MVVQSLISVLHFSEVMVYLHNQGMASEWLEYRPLPFEFGLCHMTYFGQLKVHRHDMSNALKYASMGRSVLLCSYLLP